MQELFGKVDNLEGFTHPKFNEKFKFMNEEQSINLAKRVLEEFRKMFQGRFLNKAVNIITKYKIFELFSKKISK